MARTKERDKRANLRLRGHVAYVGLTEEQIAEQLGWHLKKVQRILNGGTRLLVNHLHIFAELTGLPAAVLLEVDAPSPPEQRTAA